MLIEPIQLKESKLEKMLAEIDGIDCFGFSVANIGDIDGNGTKDLAIGAPCDNDEEKGSGSIYIYLLDANGETVHHQKISNSEGGFLGRLKKGDGFGSSIAGIGDLNSDGIPDLAIGAVSDDDGGENKGAVWIIFLTRTATVKAAQKISETNGGFTPYLANNDAFGTSVVGLGDVNQDDIPDIAIGSINDDDGGANMGAVWVLFLEISGKVAYSTKISAAYGGFTGNLQEGSNLGAFLVNIGDLDHDGIHEIVVGSNNAHNINGTVDAWILHLNNKGVVKSTQAIANTNSVVWGQW